VARESAQSWRELLVEIKSRGLKIAPEIAVGDGAGEYERWQKRDLSTRRYVYVYVWADGVLLQARMEDHGECMLVLIGATPEGRKELIGFQVGVRGKDRLERLPEAERPAKT
jgi:transposase-like protein